MTLIQFGTSVLLVIITATGTIVLNRK